MLDGVSEVLITEERIADRVVELGEQISRDYAGKELLLVGMLKGAFVFLADLSRRITVSLTIEFVSISSYGSSTVTSGSVKIEKGIDGRFDGKHVLLVEDIVDTGYTLRMSRIAEDLLDRGAESVRVCTLLDKPCRRRVDLVPDYVGFEISDRFVIGYGLDFDGKYRNLPFVGVLEGESHRDL